MRSLASRRPWPGPRGVDARTSPERCGRSRSRRASRSPRGRSCVILESMKMEMPVEAPVGRQGGEDPRGRGAGRQRGRRPGDARLTPSESAVSRLASDGLRRTRRAATACAVAAAVYGRAGPVGVQLAGGLCSGQAARCQQPTRLPARAASACRRRTARAVCSNDLSSIVQTEEAGAPRPPRPARTAAAETAMPSGDSTVPMGDTGTPSAGHGLAAARHRLAAPGHGLAARRTPGSPPQDTGSTAAGRRAPAATETAAAHSRQRNFHGLCLRSRTISCTSS